MVQTREQTSAGGVVFRRRGRGIAVALIAVRGKTLRWGLPKGLVRRHETPAAAALREVQEETGLQAELIAPIDTIEYWYFAGAGDRRIRFHKQVHFYLMKATGGDVADHDDEVEEARWWPIAAAIAQAAYQGEQAVLSRAWELIRGLPARRAEKTEI